jgi:PLP dependent protein
MVIMTHYQQIKENIENLACRVGRQPSDITLVVVSKTCPLEKLQSVYQEGGRQFGESRVQEALEKIPQLPSDCTWHLIGSLQSNKVVKAVDSFQLIHSVDSFELAQKISEVGRTKNKNTSILLQVNTSGEITKHGLSGKQWQTQLDAINQLPSLCIEGLMTLAPYTDDQEIIRSCFRQLYQWREQWRSEMRCLEIFRHLSMGMSHDYSIAIEEGATLLRIGTAIFVD